MCRFQRRKQRNGVLQKGTYRTLRHQLKKIIMLMHHSYVLQKQLWLMSMSRTCEFKFNALQIILFVFYAAYYVIEYCRNFCHLSVHVQKFCAYQSSKLSPRFNCEFFAFILIYLNKQLIKVYTRWICRSFLLMSLFSHLQDLLHVYDLHVLKYQ